MAVSYFQRRPSLHSRSSSCHAGDGGENRTQPTPDAVPADHSIYIFPNPSSTPPTPSHRSSRSSLISVPTDFDSSDSFSFGSDSRSRTPSHATREDGTRPPISVYTDDEVEIDVDTWELTYNPSRHVEESDSDESWILEDQVERLSAGAIDFTFVNRLARRTHQWQSPDAQRNQHYWSVRPTHSRHRTISTLSSSLGSSARPPAPHPRIHIPLLSFISSLLSMDLDDPALRLLTHTDPGDAQSVLFPGHPIAQLTYTDKVQPHAGDHESFSDHTDSGSGYLRSDSGEPHGLQKLLLASLSDHSTVAIHSLRAGLAVCASHSPGITLPIPGSPSFTDLWRVVGEVCERSSQAWRDVWGRPGASDSNLH